MAGILSRAWYHDSIEGFLLGGSDPIWDYLKSIGLRELTV